MSNSPAARARVGRLLRAAPGLVLTAGAGSALWEILHAHAAGFLRMAARPATAPWLGAALAFELAGLYLSAQAWRTLSASLGSPLSHGSGIRIFGAAMLGKYIPGPAWSALASVQFGRRAGIPARRMMGTYLMSSAVSVLTAGTVGLLTMPALGIKREWWLIPSLGAGLLLAWRPQILIRLTLFAARVTHRPLPLGLRIRPGCVRLAMFLELSSWLVSGIHLWLIARILGLATPAGLPVCVGGFAIATTVGALALVTADGLGVRELVLMTVLSTLMTWPQAAAAVVASRICCTIAETAGGGMALALTVDRTGSAGTARGTATEEVPDDASPMVGLDG